MKSWKAVATAAATGLLALASPAWAAGSYDVAVDGDTSGTQYVFAATSSDAQFEVLAFGFIPIDWICATVVFGGTVNTGAAESGADAITITSSTWSNCEYNGAVWTHTPDHTPPWSINLTGPATSGAYDMITGELSGLNLNIDISSPACNFDVTGFMDLSFDEGHRRIVVDEDHGNMTVDNPGCSLFNAGDPMSFEATFDVDVYASIEDLVNDNPISGATPITIG